MTPRNTSGKCAASDGEGHDEAGGPPEDATETVAHIKECAWEIVRSADGLVDVGLDPLDRAPQTPPGAAQRVRPRWRTGARSARSPAPPSGSCTYDTFEIHVGRTFEIDDVPLRILAKNGSKNVVYEPKDRRELLLWLGLARLRAAHERAFRHNPEGTNGDCILGHRTVVMYWLETEEARQFHPGEVQIRARSCLQTLMRRLGKCGICIWDLIENVWSKGWKLRAQARLTPESGRKSSALRSACADVRPPGGSGDHDATRDIPDSTYEPVRLLEAKENEDRIREALRPLPKPASQILERLLDGWRLEEVAAQQGMDVPSMVELLMHIARQPALTKPLRDAIQEYGGFPQP